MTTGSLKRVSEQIDRRAVERVAKLARLVLSDAELDEATTRLAGMLAHFADIDALDLDEVEPMTQPYELVNVMRDDIPRETLDHDEVLAAAPDATDGRFGVPPILGLEL
jgi:aspartyl-tRNA(Asn)/glutamyl-tRNA(Gln) amidotransferase subunit C